MEKCCNHLSCSDCTRSGRACVWRWWKLRRVWLRAACSITSSYTRARLKSCKPNGSEKKRCKFKHFITCKSNILTVCFSVWMFKASWLKVVDHVLAAQYCYTWGRSVRTLKATRKKQQEINIERKQQKRDENKQRSLSGMKAKAQRDQTDEQINGEPITLVRVSFL